jgi:hypothetical protein
MMNTSTVTNAHTATNALNAMKEKRKTKPLTTPFLPKKAVPKKFRCPEFGNVNSSDACLQCPSNEECAEATRAKGSLEQEIRNKAFRPMQCAGVYDPMEQAGHRDVVYVDEDDGILALISQHEATRNKQLQESIKKLHTRVENEFWKGWNACLDKILNILSEGSSQEKSSKETQ